MVAHFEVFANLQYSQAGAIQLLSLPVDTAARLI